MLDCHIHLETGPYTLAWVKKYVGYALQRGLSEIHLLEHSYLFPEFLPMYKPVCMQNDFIDAWLGRKGGKRDLDEFLHLANEVRRAQWPLPIQFGLEVCYFPGCEAFVESRTKNLGLDFLVGSIHFIDAFAFDHKPELWKEPPLLQEMKRIGVRIQTASDAHHPSEVGLGIQEAEALVLQASKP